MNDLFEIQNQIEKLTKQASEIKAREFDSTVQEIVCKMIAFGISMKDIQTAAGRKNTRGKVKVSNAKSGGATKSLLKNPRVKTKNKSSGVVVPAKFRGPNGESWSGRGLMPRWLSALVSQGKNKEDFAITS